MSALISNLVHKEIQQLIGMGWKDFPFSEEANLFVAVRMSDSEVSFPHESYDLGVGNQELSGVWVKHRAKTILRFLRQSEAKILWEIGSGHGNVAINLQQNNIAVIGVEPLYHGAAITAKAGVRTYLGTFESLKLPSNSLAAIGVFDVLEHLDNPEDLLSEVYRVLKPGGQLLVSVPAHQWLFSDFDESIGHFRRYSKKLLSETLQRAGFIKTKTEFMFSTFVIPALILRKLPSLLGRKRKLKETLRSCSILNAVLNRLEPLLKPLFVLERLTRLPFGLSLFSVSEKRV